MPNQLNDQQLEMIQELKTYLVSCECKLDTTSDDDSSGSLTTPYRMGSKETDILVGSLIDGIYEDVEHFIEDVFEVVSKCSEYCVSSIDISEDKVQSILDKVNWEF